jgi:hypothetical protein
MFGLTARRRSTVRRRERRGSRERIVELWKVTLNDVGVERAQNRFLRLSIDGKRITASMQREGSVSVGSAVSVDGQMSKTKPCQGLPAA